MIGPAQGRIGNGERGVHGRGGVVIGAWWASPLALVGVTSVGRGGRLDRGAFAVFDFLYVEGWEGWGREGGCV